MEHEFATIFLSVDRYTNKYPFISAYVYCAWNPIRLTDTSGDTIIISGTEEQKSVLNGLLETFRERCPSQYQLLDQSSNVYNVQFSPDMDYGSGGSFIYVSGCLFDVNIKEDRTGTSNDCYTDIEVLAHELKHAEQYEKRQLGFKIIHSTGMIIPYAYDQQDEIDAALQAELFSPNSSLSYGNIKNIEQNTRSNYCFLPPNQIDVFQKNHMEVTNGGKINNNMTIDERNDTFRSVTIIYNKINK